MKKVWNVAIYARVSTDKANQQESIPAQVQSLKKWLSDKIKDDVDAFYNLVMSYEDAGYSGINFNRASFIKMKEDIEQGKINMVLTRDLSRFSRNYIEAGYYIEDYFRAKGIRFISTLDNVDTLDEVSDIIPFKNILNEMYVKDCSRRVKDALKQRMLRGSSIASKPPYGYMFEKESIGNVKTIKLVPSGDDTTETVKEIFRLYLTGWGMVRISTHLNQLGISPPAARINHYKSKFKLWNGNGIKSILTNRKYGGIMVQQKWKRISYKVKKCIPTDSSEWIYGDEFEGIVEKETFQMVQDMIKKRGGNYRYKNNVIHPFSTVLKCNECGGALSYRKKFQGYKCTNSQMGGSRCTTHSIKEEYLENLVVEDLKKYVKKNINREDIYVDMKDLTKKKNTFKEEMAKADKEILLFDIKLQKVYEDKMNEVLSQRNFEFMVKGIQKRQDELLMRRQELINKESNLENEDEVYNQLKDKIDTILSLSEFDRTVVESLIDKIVVSEDKDYKNKEIKISYKFHQ